MVGREEENDSRDKKLLVAEQLSGKIPELAVRIGK